MKSIVRMDSGEGLKDYTKVLPKKAELVARQPRCRGPNHGVEKSMRPWAGKCSRFTLFFEALAIEVLRECRTVKAAASLLGLSCDLAQAIMDCVGERGFERREATTSPQIGIDEKNFDRSHDYITVLTDMDGHRVLNAAPERTQAEDDDRLKGTRQLRVLKKAHHSPAQRRRLAAHRRNGLKTARAWAIKEEFRWFRGHAYQMSVEKFFSQWHAWGALRCRRLVIKVTKMLKRHLRNLLSYFCHRITNATSEGFNSVILASKHTARGSRAFANYGTRILFFCEKLDLWPRPPCH
jgi:transposase